MSNIIPFQFNDNSIRVNMHADGEPWSSTFLANCTESVETLSIAAASGWEIKTEISVSAFLDRD